MTKLSVKAAARDAIREEKRLVKPTGSGQTLGAPTQDSFVNFAHKLGVGADNALSSGTYGYNPVSRNRQMMEWIYRGSWLGGVAVDVVADDMTRAGVDLLSEMQPGDGESLERAVAGLGCWDALNEAIKWGRLYGGAIAVMLVDGQDMKTPLRLESVGKDQFKGLVTLDRWMVEPSLGDLVTDFGPHMGTPKFYTVQANAPALRGLVIHHSRIALRSIGIPLPYQQALTENLWGISVIERLYDRMIAFDSATTGGAQLVFKSHLRTLKIPELRQIVAAGGPIMDGLLAYTEVMRRFQGIEGITLIDGEDEFDVQGSGSAITGIGDIIDKLGAQLSGALQIPITRLFGQSPGGLNATGESDLRTYYDHIRQQQRRQMSAGVTNIYKLAAQSEGLKLPDNFAIDFSSLWEMDDGEKAEISNKVVDAVTKAKDAGLVSDQVALKELRQSSRTTGIFTNITEDLINAADDQITPPIDEAMLAGIADPEGATPPGGKTKGREAAMRLPGDEDGGAPKLKRTPLNAD